MQYDVQAQLHDLMNSHLLPMIFMQLLYNSL